MSAGSKARGERTPWPSKYRGDANYRVRSRSARKTLEMGRNWKLPAEDAAPKLSTILMLAGLCVLTLAGPKQRVSCLVEKWTVGIPGGQDEADRVASENSCKNLGLVTGFSDVYLFEKRVSAVSVHREKRALEAHPFVSWVDPQTPQKRFKRDGFLPLPSPPQQAKVAVQQPGGFKMSAPAHHKQQPLTYAAAVGGDHSSVLGAAGAAAGGGVAISSSAGKRPFNDELWTHQWYLQDNANVAQLQSEIELNVEDVWKMGFTGHGIVVTILDDGLEWNHTDILPNYDARASWDMNNNRSDPFPRYDSFDSNSHGTRCAGEVSMVANNRKCGVGVAPRARIGGIKCLDGEVADVVESMSLLHNIDYIDIYSGSWGPSDNGQTVDGPKRLASQALERGVKYGRKGKGSLYVWANGNGGALGDNCNCDGYANSIYTISIGGVTQQGQIPFYGERCSSTLAVTCSSGAHTDRKIVTTDLHNKCTIDYTGTSAAAPLAAGVYALALEANNNLTWRDVQHLTAWTSNPVPLRDNPGWKRNAAGLIFNSRFGFGLLNARAMVEAALKWHSVPRKSICVVSPSTRMPVFLQSRNMAKVVFVSDGCQREYEQQQQHKQQQQFMLAQQQQQQQQQAQVQSNYGQQQVPAHLVQQQQQQQHQQPLMINRNLGVPQLVGSKQHSQQQQQQLAHSQHAGPSPVIYLEHVQLIIDLEYTSRGSLDIFLVSPAGTVSTLLSRRPLDVSRTGFDKWPLMSVHFWAESSHGKWTLIVRDKDSQNNRGLLRNATLVLHGTSARPAHMSAAGAPRVYEGEAEVSSFIDPVLELDEDDIYDLNTFPNDMSLVRDDSFQPTFIKSIIAERLMSSQRQK